VFAASRVLCPSLLAMLLLASVPIGVRHKGTLSLGLRRAGCHLGRVYGPTQPLPGLGCILRQLSTLQARHVFKAGFYRLFGAFGCHLPYSGSSASVLEMRK